MEHYRTIQNFLKADKRFKEQEGSFGKRFHFMKDGEKSAYLWFKYTLNGWNMIIRKVKEQHNIDSVEKLKTLLSL